MNQPSRIGALSPAMCRLIDALAQHAVQEHLTAEAAARKASELERSNPVPLPGFDQAA